MSFIYLATPYSKFKGGIEEANRLASLYAGEFIKEGLPVFCPIAHSHSISVHGNLSAKDHGVWMPLDFAFCDAAFALVIATMDGWDESYGINEEIKYMTKLRKPIYEWQPPTISDKTGLLAVLKQDWASWLANHKA